MSMLDIHALALNSINEGHHYFLLRYKAAAPVVYGFVEGKDDPMFYRSIIERFLPDAWDVELIKSGGRDKVLDSYKSLDWRVFDPRRIAFFIDSDFYPLIGGDPIAEENVYLTDEYSIENSIVSEQMLIVVLAEVFNVVDLEPREGVEIQDRYLESLYRFVDMVKPILCQIVLWRKVGLSANLNNIDLRSMYRFSAGRLEIDAAFTSSSDRIALAAASVGLPRDEEEQIDAIEAEMRAAGGGPTRFVRGKYLLGFFVQFASHVHAYVEAFAGAYKSPPKMRVTFGPANAMIYIAPRARCPASLRAFIDRTFLSYIENTGVSESVGV